MALFFFGMGAGIFLSVTVGTVLFCLWDDRRYPEHRPPGNRPLS